MLMNLRKYMTSQKGFTLVELLVVIVIIGVLAAIAVPKFTGTTERANGGKIASDLRAIDTAIQLYAVKNSGAIPTAIADIVTAGYLTVEPKPPSGKFIGTVTTTSTDITATSYTITNGRASMVNGSGTSTTFYADTI